MVSGTRQPKSSEAKGKPGSVLQVRGLRTHFFTPEGVVKAVDGMGLSVRQGEILGLVGESGCGKSVTALSILRLVQPPGKIVAGEVIFNGMHLEALSESQMDQIRGREIAMIFQQPQSSLNPVFSVGYQLAEIIQAHESCTKQEAWDQAVEHLRRMGIADAQRAARAYPHELSGGQVQRVAIAMALAPKPVLVIADEPTAALDVTIQAQILDLLREVRESTATTMILITHDLEVVAELADRVAVMYAGHIIEQAETDRLFGTAAHPYSQGLISSIPQPGSAVERLRVIPGSAPDGLQLPRACRFAPRCEARLAYELTICTQRLPALLPVHPGHEVRCWLYHGDEHHQPPLLMSKEAGRVW